MTAKFLILVVLMKYLIFGQFIKPAKSIDLNIPIVDNNQGRLEDNVESLLKSVDFYEDPDPLKVSEDTLLTGELTAVLPKRKGFVASSKLTKHMKESAKQQDVILSAIKNLHKEIREHDHEHVHLDFIRKVPETPLTRRTTSTTTSAPTTTNTSTSPPQTGTLYPIPESTHVPSNSVYSTQYTHQPGDSYRRSGGSVPSPPNNEHPPYAAGPPVSSNCCNMFYCYTPCPFPQPPASFPAGPAFPPPNVFPSVLGYPPAPGSLQAPGAPPAAPGFPPAPRFQPPPGLQPVPGFPPMPGFFPVPPPPVIVPARTYYEPVVHDHAPLREINEHIKKDRKDFKKWKKYRNSYKLMSEPSSRSDSSDSISDTSVSVDYY